MKKLIMLWILAVIMLVGKEAQAVEFSTDTTQEKKDASAIMRQSQAVMNAKSVMKVDEYVTINGKKEKLFTVAADINTKISYVDMLGLEFYMDEKNHLIYIYEPTKKKWYVGDDGTADELDAETPDTNTTYADAYYTYTDTILYQNVRCDVIETDVTGSLGMSSHVVYYVNESTFELLYIRITNSPELISEVYYSYPESVMIPQKIVNSAVLVPGSSVTVNGIAYTAPKTGAKLTVEVTNGKKATGNVTIPDKITFAGKKYKVTGIADNAFAKNKKLKKITIGSNIKTIGKKAFYNCKNLKQVTIHSKSLKKIGSNAFYGTAKKLKVQTPKGKQTSYRKLLEKSKISSKLKVSTAKK